MSELPKLHTPYDGSSRPFTIGLKPLDLNDWLDVDALLPDYLAEKQRLTKEEYANIVVSEPGSEAAQSEVLDLVSDHVCTHFPQVYTRQANVLTLAQSGTQIDLTESRFPPLHVAASLIQEDLILMRKGPSGWRLVAASLCFPSAWNLREKFGKPMHEIHAPVPGFGAGTRNAELIERMFNNLRLDNPVLRWNWSLYGDSRLYHPESGNRGERRFGGKSEPENVNLRLERQTLRMLPQSKDILFTIRIFIDPLQTLQTHPDGPTLIKSICDQIAAMSDLELGYKGLMEERDRLLSHLHSRAGLPT